MDGVHLLRKRQHTRLWYRALPATAQPATPPTELTSSTDLLVHVASAAEEAAWAELLATEVSAPVPAPPVAARPVVTAPVVTAPLVDESLLQTRRLGQPEPIAKPNAPATPAPNQVTAPLAADNDDWRTVPDTAPSLLLSSTDLLDARNPGPVLRPGVRYRLAGVQNGVVGLYVIDTDGESGLGFCAAVDLICIDSRFNRYRVGRTPNVSKHPFRSRMQRLTGGLTQATTSLLGAAASHGSR